MGALVLKNHSDYLHTIYESDVKCQLFCLLEVGRIHTSTDIGIRLLALQKLLLF